MSKIYKYTDAIKSRNPVSMQREREEREAKRKRDKEWQEFEYESMLRREEEKNKLLQYKNAQMNDNDDPPSSFPIHLCMCPYMY
jgi:hypothetical protein